MDGYLNTSDTICAQATVHGSSAIAVIRVSGPDSIDVVGSIFKPYKGVTFSDTKSHNLRFGAIYKENELLDEVVVSLFRAPHPYTGEDSVEI